VMIPAAARIFASAPHKLRDMRVHDMEFARHDRSKQ